MPGVTSPARSSPLLFVARFTGGLGASNIGSAQAVVADVTPVEKRTKGMGLIGAAIGLGFVVGPALGGGLAGRLVKRWGERSLLIAGLLMLAAGLALLAWSTNLTLLLIALGVVSAGDGVVTPMVSTLLSFASPPGEQGETLGLAQGVARLGRALGPLAAGSIFALGGPGAPFFFGSALVVLAALIALPALSSKREVSPTHATPEVRTVSTVQDRS